MNRYEITPIIGTDFDRLTDNLTGKETQIHKSTSTTICELLNHESERADKIIESFLTKELLNLKFEKDIYERFSKETTQILKKYDIQDLQELDQILGGLTGK